MAKQARSIRVEGVVLRHRELGEADRILSIFTRQRGKVSAIAKGVRKAKSRKSGHLQPLTHVRLQLAVGRNLYIITQAEAIQTFSEIRKDLAMVGLASYAAELVDRFAGEEDENYKMYILLVETLSRLNDGDDLFLVLRYFEVQTLKLVGYKPQLFHCVACEEEIKPQAQFFSIPAGGVLCPTCGPRDQAARSITVNALRYLRHYQRSEYTEAARAIIPADVQDEITKLLEHYIIHLLERRLNSVKFMQDVGG